MYNMTDVHFEPSQKNRSASGCVPRATLQNMDVQVTNRAARENVLRIWLSRAPKHSNIFYAFRPDQDPGVEKPLGEAHVYGRGFGSDAMERVMLIFYLKTSGIVPDYKEGETLKLLTRNKDGSYQDSFLDILEVE